MHWRKTLLAALLATTLTFPLAQAADNQPINTITALPVADEQAAPAPTYQQNSLQNTRYGYVQGVKEEHALIWKGIPYGTARRWKAPTNPAPWQGVLEATHSGPIAIQGSVGKTKGVEDALNLDIYRPDTAETKLPVFYYIHGGNNQTSGADQVDFKQFAEKANVVVVSINHRLGAFGFNPLPALKHGTAEENSGNFAILDMVQALDWTRDNIESFGGNPANITISGFSSGGRDVMALLISPIAQGKFQKAISLSGGMTTSDTAWAQQIFADHFAPLVVADGLAKTEEEAHQWILQDTPEVRSYLTNLSPDRVAAAFGKAGIRMEKFPHLYTDGTVIAKDGFDTTTYNQVPLIMVTGTDEFSLFTQGDPYFAASIKDKTVFTDAKKHAEFAFAKTYGSRFYELFNAEASAVKMFDHYQDAPIYTMAIAYGSNPGLVGKEAAFTHGAVHGIWVPFLSGYQMYTVSSFPKGSFDNDGVRAATTKVQQYLGNFMRTGNPNGKGLVQWKAWTSANEGPSQLWVDADDKGAITYQTYGRKSYDDILKDMEADTSVTPEEKDILIHQVLNGRWFSEPIDEHFKKVKK